MDNQDFTITYLIDQFPTEVFTAITNVKSWWAEDLQGNSANFGATG